MANSSNRQYMTSVGTSSADLNGHNLEQSHKLAELEERVLMCEFVNMALISLLKKKGLTREDLNEEVYKYYQGRIEYRKKTMMETSSEKCPKCGRGMIDAKGNPFLMRCMYCETEKFVYPYEKYEKFVNPTEPEEVSPAMPIEDEWDDL